MYFALSKDCELNVDNVLLSGVGREKYHLFIETQATPMRTRETPIRWWMVNGSLMMKIARMMVNTGPVAPNMDVREAPILEMASVIMKLGITVQMNASERP